MGEKIKKRLKIAVFSIVKKPLKKWEKPKVMTADKARRKIYYLSS